MAWSWKKLEGSIQVLGVRRVFDASECEKCRADIGFKKLPVTYRDYMMKLGCGIWDCGLFLSVPNHKKRTAVLKYCISSWEKSNAEIALRDYSFIVDPERRRAAESKPPTLEDIRLSRLIEFGNFGDGYCIYWDKDRMCADGDMKITVANARDNSICDFDGTLLQFLGEAIVEGKLYEICGKNTSIAVKPVFTALSN